MRKIIKNQKGISLVILVLTVMIMMIMSTAIVVNTKQHGQAKAVTNLKNDLEVLKQRVNVYVATNGKLPILKEYTGSLTHLEEVKNANDDANYYVIDLNKLSNLTLNFGQGYYDFIKNRTSTDVYIINGKTQTIYYVQGIAIGDKIQYRN